MIKIIITFLIGIILLAGCSMQSNDSLEISDIQENDSNKEENLLDTVEDTKNTSGSQEMQQEELSKIPGKYTIDVILEGTEAWLEQENGLTPFSDIKEENLSWLLTPYLHEYIIEKHAKLLANGDKIIIIKTVDISDDLSQYKKHITENVHEYALKNNTEFKVNISNLRTDIFLSKENMPNILNAFLSSEQGNFIE